MMEFLKHLKPNEETETLTKLRIGMHLSHLPRINEPIQFNEDILLSIQCSYAHYCIPRNTLPYNKYRDMEIGIVKSNEFVKVEEVLELEENKWENYYDTQVYGYVPVDLIEELYQALKQKYGLKKEVKNNGR